MARGDSGRIVIEVNPEAKRRLYDALDLAGSTLKEWFTKRAADFCAEVTEPPLFNLADVAPAKKIRTLDSGMAKSSSRKNRLESKRDQQK